MYDWSMKKTILALLLLSACNTSVNVQQPAVLPTPVGTENLQTYKYLPYNFEFKYSDDFGFASPQYGDLEDQIVTIQIPNTDYPKTNFGDAAFTVSVSYPKKDEDCFDSEGRAFSQTNVTINGIDFLTWGGTGAAAGNIYEEKVYRTMHEKYCFELREIIHTSNIGNYDPGTVTEIDKKPLWEKLDAVVSSFKFTQQK